MSGSLVDLDAVADLGARFPIDDLADATDKHDRGTVLIIGGSVETPGGVALAALAALRAGAGRVQIATVTPVAAALGVSVPETRVIGLPADGADLAATALDDLTQPLADADVVLLGTGVLDPDRMADLTQVALARVADDCRVVLDAAALAIGSRRPETVRAMGDRVLAMPNVTEAGHLVGRDPEWVAEHPRDALAAAVDQLSCVVTLRGSVTYSAGPGSPHHRDGSGTPQLATAGSGDVLAGALAGLATRTDDLLTAAIRGVRAHALAGRAATRRVGGAILARELIPELGRCLEAG